MAGRGRGVELDRALAIYVQDGKIASGKTTRRFRRMRDLFAQRSWDDGTSVWVETPDGVIYRSEDPEGWAAVSQVVGEPVEIRPEGQVAHKDDAPIHLVTTSSLGRAAILRPGFDEAPERCRPNPVVDVDGADRIEEGWVGKRLQVGSCVLRVTKRTEQCVMPALAQEAAPESAICADYNHLITNCSLRYVAVTCRRPIAAVPPGLKDAELGVAPSSRSGDDRTSGGRCLRTRR